jgi:hypothetical protein
MVLPPRKYKSRFMEALFEVRNPTTTGKIREPLIMASSINTLFPFFCLKTSSL